MSNLHQLKSFPKNNHHLVQNYIAARCFLDVTGACILLCIGSTATKEGRTWQVKSLMEKHWITMVINFASWNNDGSNFQTVAQPFSSQPMICFWTLLNTIRGSLVPFSSRKLKIWYFGTLWYFRSFPACKDAADCCFTTTTTSHFHYHPLPRETNVSILYLHRIQRVPFPHEQHFQRNNSIRMIQNIIVVLVKCLLFEKNLWNDNQIITKLPKNLNPFQLAVLHILLLWYNNNYPAWHYQFDRLHPFWTFLVLE